MSNGNILDIVERKQAERALIETEEKYHLLFANLPVGIVLIDTKTGNIADYNYTFQKQTGRQSINLTGIKIWELIPPIESKIFKSKFVRSRKKRMIRPMDQRILRPDKTVIDIRLEGCLVRVRENEFVQFAVWDITDRKRMEDALRKSEQFNTSLLDNSPNAILVHNLDTAVIYANSAFEELTGFTSAEILGLSPPYPWWAEETQCNSKANLSKILHQRKTREVDIFQKKSGEKIIVEINSRSIKIKRKFKYLLSSWVNITERQQSENALREAEQFNASILNESPNPIIVINPDMSIKYVNPALEELTGFSSAELIGVKPPYPWWLDENIDKDTKHLRRALQGGQWKVERNIINKSGECLWVQISSTSIKQDGEVKYYFSNWVDITERKEAEQKLKRLNEELRTLSAHLVSIRENERTYVAREVHDEFGQALATLKMYVCWLANNLNGDQDSKRKIIETMSGLIDLTVQRVKRLCIELRPALLDDIELSGTIEWLTREFQEATGITVNLAFQANEKMVDKNAKIALFRILQEALTNIYRHANATAISISLRQVDNKVVLKVRDNGIGIKQDQISSLKSLGLIGMRERVRFLGGNIKIKGLNNMGTNIIVQLPLLKEKS